jgi:hypothetical protein
MYQAVCDNCGKDCSNEDYYAWPEERLAIEDALYMGWQIIDDKLYCPNCFEYDYKIGGYKPKKEKRMTVQELIDELMKVPDKSAEVFYLSDSGDFFNNLEVYSMGKIYGDDEVTEVYLINGD